MTTENLPYIMKMTLGDWSADGHGKTDVHNLRSNRTPEEIGRAYQEAVRRTGIKFDDVVADGYEDRSYPQDAFRDLGCPPELCGEHYVEDCDHYIQLFGWFCSLALPDLILQHVEDEIPELIWKFGAPHMGYGLF